MRAENPFNAADIVPGAQAVVDYGVVLGVFQMRISIHRYDMLNVYVADVDGADERVIEYQISPRIRSGNGAVLGYVRRGSNAYMNTVVVLTSLVTGDSGRQVFEYYNTEFEEACTFLIQRVREAMADVNVHKNVREVATVLYDIYGRVAACE